MELKKRAFTKALTWPWTERTTVLLALTATATKFVRGVVKKSIGFDDNQTVEIIRSLHKVNTTYNYFVSHARQGGHSQHGRNKRLLNHVEQMHAVLVFVETPHEADTLRDRFVNNHGIVAEAFHGQSRQYEREVHSRHFASGAAYFHMQRARAAAGLPPAAEEKDALQVLFCTLSFGMGIDIQHIERVMILYTPWRLGTTLQQGLRGGRGVGDSVVVDIYLSFQERWSHIQRARRHALEGASGDGAGASKTRSAAGVDDNADRLRAAKLAEDEVVRVFNIALNETGCFHVLHDKAMDIPEAQRLQKACGTRCSNCKRQEKERTRRGPQENVGDQRALDLAIAKTLKDCRSGGIPLLAAVAAVRRGLSRPPKEKDVIRRMRMLLCWGILDGTNSIWSKTQMIHGPRWGETLGKLLSAPGGGAAYGGNLG